MLKKLPTRYIICNYYYKYLFTSIQSMEKYKYGMYFNSFLERMKKKGFFKVHLSSPSSLNFPFSHSLILTCYEWEGRDALHLVPLGGTIYNWKLSSHSTWYMYSGIYIFLYILMHMLHPFHLYPHSKI